MDTHDKYILYNTSNKIYGFQFNVRGVKLKSIITDDLISSKFNISSNTNLGIVIGFTITEEHIMNQLIDQ